MDEILQTFIDDVKELLLRMEQNLISLEKDPCNPDMINQIFRVMHTLKGTAGMVGFKDIQEMTHEFEGVYEQVRQGMLIVTSEIIDLTLEGKDMISSIVNGNTDKSKFSDLLERVTDLGRRPANNSSPSLQSEPAGNHDYIILFMPDADIYKRGLNPGKIIMELQSTGETAVYPYERNESLVKPGTDRKCTTSWEIYLRTTHDLQAIAECFLFYDPEEFEIFEVTKNHLLPGPDLSIRLSKLHKTDKLDVERIRDQFEALGKPAPKSPPTAIDPACISLVAKTAELQKIGSDLTINVSSHKLDELMNLVSELVTLTATSQSQAEKFNDPKLNVTLESIEKLTKQFRNNALDLRLVPVGTLIGKVRRQVRDLSRELGKKINLLVEGQDIEIDKTILRSIESPLQHIIRNSIDHGIETENERLKKGKLAEGLLKITAFYSGANVIIQIQDDGGGINLDKVRDCAIRVGLLQADKPVTKQELLNMIIEPGFTTAENISLVSGRGVGMDVVKKELNLVGGGFEIFTEKDLGTSIVMKLPTTLTIIDTLKVDIAETQILIPINDIEYCFKDESSLMSQSGKRYIQYKNHPVPLVSLREQFQYPPQETMDTMIIVINKFDRKFAIAADQIAGEHQAVIKPLGELFASQPFFSGGSIMADGKLAFILDTNFLYSHATIQHQTI